MHKLSSDTSKLISSSQVITSVVSVVKELVENSLDADASVIEIKLENFGLNKIEVRDNGNGIDHEAVKVAAQCHYTSKISSHIDLQSLNTYGFRGEALSSLCEMSQACLTTRTADESHSMQYTLDKNGNITATQPSHLGKGTTITARNLFHNIPVRKQFYNSIKKKKDQLKLVEDIVMAFGLIHHHVRISLWNDKSLIWQKHATSNNRTCVQNVFGTPVFTKLTNVQYTTDDGNIVLEGYLPITTQGCDSNAAFRKTNDRSFLYVNKRPIRDKEIDKTLKKLLGSENDDAAKNSKKWPVMVLNITLPLSAVDANIEADKRKVATPLLTQVIGAIQQLIDSEKLKLTAKTTKEHQPCNKKSCESSGVVLEDETVVEQQLDANDKNFDSTVRTKQPANSENCHAFSKSGSSDNGLESSTSVNFIQSRNEKSTNENSTNHESRTSSSNQSASHQPTGMLSSTQKPHEELNVEPGAWSRGEAIMTQSDIQPVKILTSRVEDNKEKETVTHKRERVKDLANQGGFEGLSPIAKKSRIDTDDTFDLMFSMDEHDFSLSSSNKENEPKTVNNTLRFDESAIKTPTHRKKDDKPKQRKLPRHSFISNWTVVKEREYDSKKPQSNAFGNNSDVILSTTQSSVQEISNKIKKKTNKPQTFEEENILSLIGNVNYGETIAALLLLNNAFYLTNNQHSREVSLYHKLLENHTFTPRHRPSPEVVKRRTLQPSAIFALEDMDTVQSNNSPSVTFESEFMEKNGIELKQFTDPESNRVMLEIHSYPIDLPGFDIQNINELLHNITLQGDNKTISNTRPEICKDYLKREATRISSTMPGNLSLQPLNELQRKTKDFMTLTCLHQKPVFTKIHTFK